ncbi:AcrR family transcriptional regulator [Gordonia amarae]|uniref:TetR/AcrR family transcriptional regulator n=1 Tax=Gordonia amarae TaxID=36821 RepID=UPI0014785082|nr:TetR/AcrR family transcriptional regulator [Gordonia amarae]MCS3876508.1 AcrR family transcriptional regulator [Gordonia amarae]
MTLPNPSRSDGRRNVQRIMEAATSVWAVNPDAPLQEVAKAAGVDRATLYRHFPTRAALFQTVAPPAFDEIGGLLVDLPTEGPALPVLTSLIEPFIGLGNRYAFVVTHATAATQDRAVDVALSESLEALIIRAQQQREIDPGYHPAYVAGMYTSVIKNAVILVARGILDPETGIAQAQRAFTKAMEVTDDDT